MQRNEFDEGLEYDGPLEGGRLAASLSKEMRMSMIQFGYNPSSPADVDAFKKRQKPREGMKELIGEEFLSRGTGQSDLKDDYGRIDKELGGSQFIVDGEEQTEDNWYKSEGEIIHEQNKQSSVNPRDIINQRVNEHLDNRPSRQPNFQIDTNRQPKKMSSFNERVQNNINKTKKTMQEQGYDMGLDYINSFIDLIKNPSPERRTLLMKNLAKVAQMQKTLQPREIKDYQEGLASAERELFSKIKNR